MFQAKVSKERLDVVKSLMACKLKPGASICAFVLKMKGYFNRLESLNMVLDAELSINIILSGKAAQGKFDRGSKRKAESEIAPTSDPKEAVFFYCNTRGNWKRSCPKYLKDLKDGKVEKGGHSGLKERRLEHGELNLVMGNRKITPVTRIGKYELMLKSGVRIYLNTSPCKGIYETVECISNNGNEILNVGSSNDLDKSKLWHSRLGHVNKKCIAQLQKDGVLESFDFKSDNLTPPRTPQINGVAERRNRTLLDMVRSMMCRATLPIRFWGYVLETAAHILNLGCEVFVRREAQDKLEARSKKCLFVGYLEESFGYLFYKPKDNVVFVARRGVFLEREMISKEDSGSKIDLEEIQESADEEPIVNIDTQQEVVTPVEPNDISLPIRRTSNRVSKPPQFYYGFHIEEDKISDSTLSELDEPANYKEAMASPEATKWKEAMKSKIQSVYDNQV
ncbi:retrotransposon protein, putative, ty1-copia subclass [Tanacetum coccineum]